MLADCVPHRGPIVVFLGSEGVGVSSPFSSDPDAKKAVYHSFFLMLGFRIMKHFDRAL
jgi:hypothetical protein